MEFRLETLVAPRLASPLHGLGAPEDARFFLQMKDSWMGLYLVRFGMPFASIYTQY